MRMVIDEVIMTRHPSWMRNLKARHVLLFADHGGNEGRAQDHEG
jgi:hypothetical protein